MVIIQRQAMGCSEVRSATRSFLPVGRVDEAVLAVGGAVVLDRLHLPRNRAVLQHYNR